MHRMRRHRGRLLGCLVAAGLLLAGCSAPGSDAPNRADQGVGVPSGPPTPSGTAALTEADFLRPADLDSGSHGITVTGARALSERAVEIAVSTDAVDPRVPGGHNSVIIVRPEHYDPDQRYPSVYLLGGSGAETTPALQWYEAGQAEQITARLPVITVNRTGHEPDWSGVTGGIQFWGQSFVAGPQGEILYKASVEQEENIVLDIDKQRTEDVRRIWPFFRDRRIEYYDGLTKRYLD